MYKVTPLSTQNSRGFASEGQLSLFFCPQYSPNRTLLAVTEAPEIVPN